MKDRKMIILFIVLIFFIIVFFFSLYHIILWYIDNQRTNYYIQELQDMEVLKEVDKSITTEVLDSSK